MQKVSIIFKLAVKYTQLVQQKLIKQTCGGSFRPSEAAFVLTGRRSRSDICGLTET